jgi:hypothetical protein
MLLLKPRTSAANFALPKGRKEDELMYGEMIKNLSQENTSLAGEASNTQAAQFEAALENSCARLHNMQLIVLLNSI